MKKNNIEIKEGALKTFNLRGRTSEVYNDGVLETFYVDGKPEWHWKPFNEPPRKKKFWVRLTESPFWPNATKFMLLVNMLILLVSLIQKVLPLIEAQ